MRKFHCCATCIHYRVEKDKVHNKTSTKCSRLKFDTKPTYQFNCWDPKIQVKKLMEKEEDQYGI